MDNSQQEIYTGFNLANPANIIEGQKADGTLDANSSCTDWVNIRVNRSIGVIFDTDELVDCLVYGKSSSGNLVPMHEGVITQRGKLIILPADIQAVRVSAPTSVMTSGIMVCDSADVVVYERYYEWTPFGGSTTPSYVDKDRLEAAIEALFTKQEMYYSQTELQEVTDERY